ncbi:MAG: TonB-dependent receptor [candidate division Zixibacteria bacterium]|nr:TonB-dependent receptor [candidate division Zixibacteria bacterium]
MVVALYTDRGVLGMLKLKGILVIAIAVSFFAVTGIAHAQGKGSIEGKVYDAETGEPLPGASVLVKGTYLGAPTDFEGEYRIRKVNPGTFTLEITLIGYAKVIQTGVEVKEGETTIIDVEMKSTAVFTGQEVVVVGEKPLLDIEATESRTTINSRDIEVSTMENLNDIVESQVGVVRQGNEIHIRGGRDYENSYIVDGISVQDPFSGGTAGLNVSAKSVEKVEILTGGFNAEYGQAMSGVIEVKTKEGSKRFEGSVTYKTDDIMVSEGNNTDVFDISLSGPMPLRGMTFFLSGYSLLSDTYLPHSNNLYSSLADGDNWAIRGDNNYSILGKVIWKIKEPYKLVYSYSASLGIDQGFKSNVYDNPDPSYDAFPYEYEFNLDNYNTFTRISNKHTLNWTHITSPKFFYEVKFSKFFTQLRSDVAGKNWSEYEEPIDINPINYFPVVVNGDTIGYAITAGDGFYDYGDGDKWHDHYVDQYTVQMSASYSPGERHVFKAGINNNWQEMQMIDIYQPWVNSSTGLGLNHDIYKVFPSYGASYIQDKISFGGLIINAGLRLDWWFPGKYVDDAINDTSISTISPQLRQQYEDDTFEMFGLHGKAHLSPRLGVSHPISDRMMLFYSYGHFSKLPKPQRVYAKLRGVSESTYQLFGNPNLNPETTVSYELGVRYELTQNDVLSATAYYKDIFDYIAAQRIQTSGRTGSSSFLMYFNLDYARSRGIEVEYKKRAGNHFSAVLQTAYAIATGKSSSPKDELLIAKGELEEKSIKENHLAWDRPFRFSVDINIFSEENDPMRILGWKTPDDWNLYFKFFYQTGKRYTSYKIIESGDGSVQEIPNLDDPYDQTGEDWHWVDISFQKYFRWKGMKYTLFCEINNLFDSKNSKIINPLTGKAYEYGDPVLESWNDPINPDPNPTYPFPFNPARYLEPRNIMLGVTMEF